MKSHCIVLMLIASAGALSIIEYKAPIVAVKEGIGFIANGNFNLVHVIRLETFEQIIDKIWQNVEENILDFSRKSMLRFQIQGMKEKLRTLSGRQSRTKRSIDWVGSAWKWIAGNPDAADWNFIVSQVNGIIENNNHQYKINENLFDFTKRVMEEVQEINERHKNEIKTTDAIRFEQDVFNQLLLLKNEIDEVVRACQLAKNGIINTNVLDREEISQLVAELEILPYSNELEAIEFAKPTVYTNGTMLIYVLAMPKIREETFNAIITKSTIANGNRVELPFDKMLINHQETYGIIGSCNKMNNSTVCKEEDLKKVPEDFCIPQLLKGGHAKCPFQTANETEVQLVKEGTIFLNNFDGFIRTDRNISRHLRGTFIVQITNEELYVGDKIYKNSYSSTIQALPPILANVTSSGHTLDLKYLHNMTITNINRIKNLTERFKHSLLTDFMIFILLALLAILVWRKLNGRLHIPRVNPAACTPNNPN